MPFGTIQKRQVQETTWCGPLRGSHCYCRYISDGYATRCAEPLRRSRNTGTYCVPEPPLFRKVIKYLCGFAAAFADDKDLAGHAMLLPDFGRKRPHASIPPIDGRSPKDNRG